jgi:hypothetical protein
MCTSAMKPMKPAKVSLSSSEAPTARGQKRAWILAPWCQLRGPSAHAWESARARHASGANVRTVAEAGARGRRRGSLRMDLGAAVARRRARRRRRARSVLPLLAARWCRLLRRRARVALARRGALAADRLQLVASRLACQHRAASPARRARPRAACCLSRTA